MAKLSDKYNDSCIRMFNLLKLLDKGCANYEDVIALFTSEATEGKSNPHVALNKYLNTLNIFGVKVKKKNNKFYMLSAPYRIDFNSDDLEIIKMFKEYLKVMSNGKLKTNFQEFINAIEVRYSESTKTLAEAVNSTQNIDYSFGFSELKDQILKCEQYCQDNLKLEITYKDLKGQEAHIICSPVELIYQKRKICLCVNIQAEGRLIEIPLDNIKTITQLPTSANKQLLPTTISFKLKNRLAKNYRLREHESIRDIEPDGSIIIINKNEDYDLLLRRLLRYGTQCEIISPKFIKDEMIALLNKTLANYEE